MYHEFVVFVSGYLDPRYPAVSLGKKKALTGVSQTLAKLHISLFSLCAWGILLIPRKGAERREKGRHTQCARDSGEDGL